MRLFFKNISRILFIGLGLSMLISIASLWALRQSSFYKPTFLAQAVKETQFDYIILGSSIGLTTLDTKVIDSVLNTNGLNLSMDDTALSSQYLMLQHFLAEGKTTKYCVLAPGNASFNSTIKDLSSNDYRFLMYGRRPYVSEYYSTFSSKEAHVLSLSKWLPMVGVSYYNAEVFYPSLISLVNPIKQNRFDNKGNYTYPVIHKTAKPILKSQDLNIKFANNYIDKIKTLCHANNIELICYLSPMETKNAIVKSSDFEVLNHSNLLTNTKYFYDTAHVNSLGRKIASLRFALDAKDYFVN